MLHHSPVGVLHLAGPAEGDGVWEALQGLLEGLQVQAELLQAESSRKVSRKRRLAWPGLAAALSSAHAYLLVSTLDQELTELQHFHHFLLRQLVISLLDLLETLEKEKTRFIYGYELAQLYELCVCSCLFSTAAVQAGQKCNSFCR